MQNKKTDMSDKYHSLKTAWVVYTSVSQFPGYQPNLPGVIISSPLKRQKLIYCKKLFSFLTEIK